jgi:hypothetical protein
MRGRTLCAKGRARWSSVMPPRRPLPPERTRGRKTNVGPLYRAVLAEWLPVHRQHTTSSMPQKETTPAATLDGGAHMTLSSARFSGERRHRVCKEQGGGRAGRWPPSVSRERKNRGGKGNDSRVLTGARFCSGQGASWPSGRSNG